MKLKHIALTLATLAALSFGGAHAAVTVAPASGSLLTTAATNADAGAKGDGIERCERKRTEHGKRDCICKFEPNNPICTPSKS